MPAITKALSFHSTPQLLHTILDLLSSCFTWAYPPQEVKPFDFAAYPGVGNGDSGMSSPQRQRAGSSIDAKQSANKKSANKKASRTFSLFSPSGKMKVIGPGEVKPAQTSAAATQEMPSFHVRHHSVTFDILCSFLTCTHWSAVEKGVAGIDELAKEVRRIMMRLSELSLSTSMLLKQSAKAAIVLKQVIDQWQRAPAALRQAHSSWAALEQIVSVESPVAVEEEEEQSVALEQDEEEEQTTKKPLRPSLRPSLTPAYAQARESFGPVAPRRSVGFAHAQKDVVHSIDSTVLPSTFMYTITPPDAAAASSSHVPVASSTAESSPVKKQPQQHLGGADSAPMGRTPSRTYISSSGLHGSPHKAAAQCSVLTYLVEQKECDSAHSRHSSGSAASIVYNLTRRCWHRQSSSR